MQKKDQKILEEMYDSMQSPISDEVAAQKIADKIMGLPLRNINDLKMQVKKYLPMVGKNDTDIDFLAAEIYDILDHKGMVDF